MALKRIFAMLISVMFIVACTGTGNLPPDDSGGDSSGDDRDISDVRDTGRELPPFMTQGNEEEVVLFTTNNFKFNNAVLRSIYVTRSADYMWVSQDISEQGNIVSGDRDGNAAITTVITIDPDKWFQPIDGFGASFTDSSAYLINQVLPGDVRDDLMVKLFHPIDGIGLSFVRNPMGASDFARFIYSYNDIPDGETDFDLENFSIDHDREDIIPLVKQALKLNPDLKLVASPWSPPAWMKSTRSMIGGHLRHDCYDVYGDYFIRFLEEYRKEGIEFYGITPQNEPLYVPHHYPGNSMSREAQVNFINQSLGPKLREFFPDVKLWCYDHNWDVTDYPEYVLRHAGEYVDGVAWHVYGGSPDAQTKVLKQFPDTEVHFTEASGGEWVPPFDAAFFGNIWVSIGVLNNHSRSVVLWNMALDENNGPVVPGFGNSTCRGVVMINQQTKELTYNLDYYALAHFSKYIRPGSVRVGSEINGSSVFATACLNEDGSLVIVALNDAPGNRVIRFDVGDFSFYYNAEAKSVVTVVIDLS